MSINGEHVSGTYKVDEYQVPLISIKFIDLPLFIYLLWNEKYWL
jgi:hypothetical protein